MLLNDMDYNYIFVDEVGFQVCTRVEKAEINCKKVKFNIHRELKPVTYLLMQRLANLELCIMK